MRAALVATLDALSNGAGLVLIAAALLFITVLLAEHIHLTRKSITKENRHDRTDR